MTKKQNPFLSAVSVVAVSIYLIAAGIFLILSGRIKPSRPLWNLLRVKFLPKRKGSLEEIIPEHGHCFIGKLPKGLISDQEGLSRLVIFENGNPLGKPHVTHDEIRVNGGGCYSHWGEQVYFSTSDNSDPSKNGRVYTFSEK